MEASPASALTGLPPRDPRGPRLRRWIPGICFVAGLGLLGLIVSYVFQEDAPRQKPMPSATTATTRHPTPRIFQELSDAANQPEVVAPVNHAPPAQESEVAQALKEIRLRLTALEAVVREQHTKSATDAPKVDKPAEDAARRDALERQKKAAEAAKKKAEEDAAAKKARVIWERKSEKTGDGIQKVTTVNSPYSLMPNWQIPCTIKKAISSQAPGTVTAMVSVAARTN
jgi:type IV secretory pathway VirB10-like protein